jgi:hypothetical protein
MGGIRVSNKKWGVRSVSAIAILATVALGMGGLSAEAVTKPGSSVATGVVEGNTGDQALVLNPDGGKPGSKNAISTLAVEPSPAGCKGQTDWPHYSAPYMSDHGRTRCTVAVEKVTAQTTLLRSRWYGWQTVLVGTTASRTNNTYSGDSSPHWKCTEGSWYRYKGQTTHTSLEGGRTYSITSSSENPTEIYCGVVIIVG